jgi:daunorubicin resistance ABC transporter ATP-binding subunit
MARRTATAAGTASAAITAEGVSKRFGDVQALDGLDLSVPANTVYGLLGPNGAGKTTAVRIFTTIFPPDTGRASVLGHDVSTEANVVRRNIGLAGQYAAVDENLTGRENLRLVGRLTHLLKDVIKQRSDDLLERFDLVDAADRPVKTYSGGMRRRLDVAAALVHRPPVLFLDEPTTGLDVQSRQALWTVIEELVADGATVLLTTQYLEEADRLADRIAVVDHGRVIAEGTPAQLKKNLGSTVLEVTFADEKLAQRAEKVLETLAKRAPVREGTAVGIPITDGTRFVTNVLTTLNKRRLAPAGLALREPSLDDVFLSLTGHRAEHEGEDVVADGDGASAANGSRNRRKRPSGKDGPPKSQASRTRTSR